MKNLSMFGFILVLALALTACSGDNGNSITGPGGLDDSTAKHNFTVTTGKLTVHPAIDGGYLVHVVKDGEATSVKAASITKAVWNSNMTGGWYPNGGRIVTFSSRGMDFSITAHEEGNLWYIADNGDVYKANLDHVVTSGCRVEGGLLKF